MFILHLTKNTLTAKPLWTDESKVERFETSALCHLGGVPERKVNLLSQTLNSRLINPNDTYSWGFPVPEHL